MVESPRILALVPARGGSKRLPGKNIRHLCGKPLISWTIQTAKKCDCFVDILVSTDSEEIAETARSEGALVPWIRPPELATDTATSVNVALHALDWYEHHHGRLSGIMLLQPTSPFRTTKTIQNAIKKFDELGRMIPVISISESESHPAWTFGLEGSVMRPFCGWPSLSLRSQDLPKSYVLNGVLYVSSPERLRLNKSFLADDMQWIIVGDRMESVDIDTAEDWDLAEYHAGRLTNKIVQR